MIIKVDEKKVKIVKKDSVNSGEANVHICNFVFSDEYEGLIKKAVFTTEEDKTYSANIVDNKCNIPIDILYKKGNIKLGVYGYELGQNDELILRYSPIPTNFYINQGSYDEDVDITKVIDTSEGTIQNTDILKDKIGFSQGEKVVGILETETKNVKSANETQIITPSENSLINEIIVQPFSMQEKNIIPSWQQQIIEPDANYDGLNKVTIDAVSSDVDPNIIPTNIRKGVSILSVEGNLEPDKPDQSKIVNPSTSEQIVMADTGYELASVTVNAIQTEQKTVKSTTSSQTITPTSGKFIDEITVEPIDLEVKTVTPTTSAQTINPTAGKDGISQINVNAVDNTIDNNIIAENIKNGVSILGVTGTYPSGTINITENGNNIDVSLYDNANVNVQPNLQTKELIINQNGTTTIAPDTGYDGISEVDLTVNVSGSGGFPPDWAEIGYSTTPQSILDDFAYSKNIADNWDTTKDSMSRALPNDKNTKLKYMPLVDTSNITSMYQAFLKCSKLETIPLLDTSNVTNMNQAFSYCSKLETIPLLDTSKVTNMNNAFSYCSILKTIPLLDTSNVTNMINMFYVCYELTTIPQLNTSNVTEMSYMFYTCQKLTNIPLLDTKKVTSMDYMFSGCSRLTTVPLLDTSNVTIMSSMFSYCPALETIPLLDTSNVTYMNNMFQSCTNLTNIPLLDTKKVTSMDYMFLGCSRLTTVPLLDTSNVTNMIDMFRLCSALSNESLNNILAMCINAVQITSANKNLKTVGLTQEQATTCQSLSNYQAFLDAGWTTGY